MLIIELIESGDKVSIELLQSKLGLGHTTIKKIIKSMQDEGFIRRVGPDKGGHWEIVKPKED